MAGTRASSSKTNASALLETHGTETTQLAAQFAPGPEPSLVGDDFSRGGSGCVFVLGMLGILITVICGAGGLVSSAVLFGIIALALTAGAVAINSTRRAEREAKIPLYERGWVCLQCGASWIPTSLSS
jgi:hypothetical protein